MAKVVLTRGLTQYTGGERELELDADNIRQLLRALGERYPNLKPHLADGVAIAIDGEIFQDAWLEPIPPDSEVHVIPQIVGGSAALPFACTRPDKVPKALGIEEQLSMGERDPAELYQVCGGHPWRYGLWIERGEHHQGHGRLLGRVRTFESLSDLSFRWARTSHETMPSLSRQT